MKKILYVVKSFLVMIDILGNGYLSLFEDEWKLKLNMLVRNGMKKWVCIVCLVVLIIRRFIVW